MNPPVHMIGRAFVKIETPKSKEQESSEAHAFAMGMPELPVKRVRHGG